MYRDRAGKRVSADELAAAQAAERKPKSETPAWGGGIAQVGREAPCMSPVCLAQACGEAPVRRIGACMTACMHVRACALPVS